jgi:hypothetical protein
MSYRFADSLRAGSGWNILILLAAPDDGHRNCPKHVDFHFKNKFENLVHLVGFLVRNYASCLKNTVYFIVAKIYKLNFNGFCPTYRSP